MNIDLIVQLLTFGVVVAVSIAIMRTVGAMLDVRRRLANGTSAPVAASGSLFKGRRVQNRFLLWVQQSTDLSTSADGVKLRRNLALAGFRHAAAPIWYVIIRFSMAIGLPLGFLLLSRLSAEPVDTTWIGLGGGGLAMMGFIAPRAFVDRRANARREAMAQEFPDALDLMVVCVEAGLGLDAAFIRVGEEVHESHPRASEEFRMVSTELRAGRTRAEALRALAERTDVDAVKAFAALLIQTDSLGTSIGQTLRSYSTEMRADRFLKAEEKAMRIPVLMTIPLVACILPVIITALLLPPVLDVVRVMMPAMTHGRG